jgi:hypothetical protein
VISQARKRRGSGQRDFLVLAAADAPAASAEALREHVDVYALERIAEARLRTRISLCRMEVGRGGRPTTPRHDRRGSR